MNKFNPLSELFLLESVEAQNLYWLIKDNPIIDYHTHISPKAMAANHKFSNLLELILGSTAADSFVFDHYFARLLIQAGLSENLVFGKDQDDYERFIEIAKIFYKLAGNPTYHWIILILKEIFGIEEILSLSNAEKIWIQTKEKLQNDNFTILGILEKRNVKVICTTDDPTDTLEWHKVYNEKNLSEIRLLPTFRPDKALVINDTKDKRNNFNLWLDKLAVITGTETNTFDGFISALKSRHDYFDTIGCTATDIGLEQFHDVDFKIDEVKSIFNKKRSANSKEFLITDQESKIYQSYILRLIGEWNFEKNWVTQYHQGPLRDANSKQFDSFGPDIGCDFIGEPVCIKGLRRFLDDLNSSGKLGSTIIYTLNSGSYDSVLSLIGGFQSSKTKIFLGVPWWFHDHKRTIVEFFSQIAEQSALALHPGMLSDSRNPASSVVRFDYFRRLLANYLVTNLPELESEALIEIAHDMTFRNASSFFNLIDI